MLLLMTTAANNDNTTSTSLGYNKEVKHTLSDVSITYAEPPYEAGRRRFREVGEMCV
jgi:hypothetical protein